jgi:hypothetical protein
MAANTTITVSGLSPKGVTIALGGGNDLNSVQLLQLKKVVDRAVTECSSGDSTLTGSAVVVPAAWDATLRI